MDRRQPWWAAGASSPGNSGRELGAAPSGSKGAVQMQWLLLGRLRAVLGVSSEADQLLRLVYQALHFSYFISNSGISI